MAGEDRYFSRSWALLTRDKGWVKPLLVLSVSCFVPIVGLLGVNGYALEWARLTAWGVDSSPKQKGVRVGECIKSGWRGFVASLGYAAVFMIIRGLLGMALRNNGLVSLIGLIASAFTAVVYQVVALRATIYQRIGAGYKFKRIWEMISRDPAGLAKIAGIVLLIEIAGGALVGILVVIAMVPFISQLAIGAYGYDILGRSTDAAADALALMLANSLGSILSWVVVISFLVLLVSTFSTLISQTAVALWMRQFNVAHWGASDDPLPDPGSLPGVGGTGVYAGGMDVAAGAEAAGYTTPSDMGAAAGAGSVPVADVWPGESVAPDAGSMPGAADAPGWDLGAGGMSGEWDAGVGTAPGGWQPARDADAGVASGDVAPWGTVSDAGMGTGTATSESTPQLLPPAPDAAGDASGWDADRPQMPDADMVAGPTATDYVQGDVAQQTGGYTHAVTPISDDADADAAVVEYADTTYVVAEEDYPHTENRPFDQDGATPPEW